MQLWKACSLGLYYWSTQPSRRREAARRIAAQSEPVRVLFYHRVADRHPNDWTISSATFARQITWLERRFDVVSLEEGQRRIASGRNSRPTVCVTFDDGYADNFQTAIPLLLSKRLPFTYFVSTNQVLFGGLFPHDLAARRPLMPNTPAQLRELANSGVEIGAHTRNHVDLGRAPHNLLVDEIVGSKSDLERALGREVRYFSFPYGLPKNISPEAIRVAKSAGFRGVCSAYGGYNFPGDEPLHIKRFHADPQMIRFRNWMTVDPRKVLKTRQQERIAACVDQVGCSA